VLVLLAEGVERESQMLGRLRAVRREERAQSICIY